MKSTNQGDEHVISLVPIDDRTEISSPVLRERARLKSTKTQVTHHYLAFRDGVEVGFVSLDMYLDRDYLMLYELIVEPSLHRQGIGTEIISSVEKMALDLGYPVLRAYPMPFMGDIPEEVLIQWYQKLGFRAIQASVEMEKALMSAAKPTKDER